MKKYTAIIGAFAEKYKKKLKYRRKKLKALRTRASRKACGTYTEPYKTRRTAEQQAAQGCALSQVRRKWVSGAYRRARDGTA